MNVWIEVKRTKTVGRIIGWCPDKKGRPRAMVQVRNKVFSYKLGEFIIISEPRAKAAAWFDESHSSWFENHFDGPLPRA